MLAGLLVIRTEVRNGPCHHLDDIPLQEGFLHYSLEAEFFLLWETSVFALQGFNRLDELHPHYQG